MVAEGNHGLQHPEDCLVMSEQVLPERYVLLPLPGGQEGLHVLVEPRLVPLGHLVYLSRLNYIRRCNNPDKTTYIRKSSFYLLIKIFSVQRSHLKIQ